MASGIHPDDDDAFLADEGGECSSCGKLFKQDQLVIGKPWGVISWRYYCSRACAADNFRSPGQRFADRVIDRSKDLKGLAGTVTRVEKCLKCGKLVRSSQMTAHIKTHLAKTRGTKIIADALGEVRSKFVSLTSGAVTILGQRKKPYANNAWRYTVMVQRGPDGEARLIGGFDTTEPIPGTYEDHEWLHNDGRGDDEGGNNRAAHLFHTLLHDYVLDSADINGTRDLPLYRTTSGLNYEDEP